MLLLFLLGLGGRAGLLLSLLLLLLILLFGATLFILGLLYDKFILLGGINLVVGATLLIGFLGGTTKLPDGI